MERKIFQSKDYNEFAFFEGNRVVDPKRVKQLMESIQTHGLINPIVVTQNKEIIDGQHRFESLKNLELPVIYHIHHVDRDKLLELVRNINSVQKNWSNHDIAVAYSMHSPNKQSYLRYLDMESLGINHASIIEASGYLANNSETVFRNNYHKFKNGNLDISQVVADKVKGFVTLLAKSPIERKIWNKAHFIRAVLHINRTTDFKFSRFFTNYQNNPYKWKNASTYEEHKRSIAFLYNYQNKKPIEVTFN